MTWQAGDLLDRLDDLQEDLARSDFADDVSGAKHGIDLHNEMKKKIVKVPVEELETQGERILQRLDAAEAAAASNGGTAFHCGEPSVVRQQLESVRQAHHHLLQLWHHKKVKLDQCFQLRLFEQDCEKVIYINIIFLIFLKLCVLLGYNECILYILDVRMDMSQS